MESAKTAPFQPPYLHLDFGEGANASTGEGRAVEISVEDSDVEVERGGERGANFDEEGGDSQIDRPHFRGAKLLSNSG
jgi:hypothetical protein